MSTEPAVLQCDDAPGIRLDRVTKVYADNVVAIDEVELEIRQGEFLVLVGPSGCGKSTLLRTIAGLEQLSSGRIWIAGRDVTELSPRQRDIAMVFQNYALYPHMTVAKNLAYGLKVRGTDKREIARRVAEVARLLGLEDMLERRPAMLSGGQRQRVAMGRAIVREPSAFLMDEPLSNLDAKLRVGMRAELARLHARLGVTTVYVTHDQVEAMTLGERVAVLRDGRVQQVDTTQRLYREPANLFVATFIGSPAMNLFDAHVDDSEATFGSYTIPLMKRPPATGRLVLGLRPHDMEAAALAPASWPTIDVVATVVEDLGSHSVVVCALDAPPADTEALRETGAWTDATTLIADDRRAMLTVEVGEAAQISPGGRAKIALDTSRLHYFDATTGNRLD